MDVKIRLAESRVPTLRQGLYRITVDEHTNIKDKDTPVVFHEEVDVVLTNRRFTLPQEEVYSVYPPADSRGSYGMCLPHIVLNHSTLPWTYGLGDVGGMIPGMALFVCAEEDGVRERRMSVSELPDAAGDAELYIPQSLRIDLADAEKGDEECRAVDLPVPLFLGMCPKAEELSLLTHVKEVALDDKVTDPLVKEGKFACVVANRFPREPGEAEAQVKHKAYLVSLREYGTLLLSGRMNELASYAYARLLCLAEWEFYVTKQPYDFRTVIKGISPGVLYGEPGEAVRDEELCDILKRGYYPIDHDLRDGSKTVSWYRGPLLPILETVAKPNYHIFSDQMYAYDPDSGLFDVSYACAWQLGRMLALQNLSVCKELLLWRFHNCHEAARQHQQQMILERLAETNVSANGADQPVSFTEVLQQTCADLLQNMQCAGEGEKDGGMDA